MEISDATVRLERLTALVKLMRAEKFITEWPKDIRKEALFLIGIFGKQVVAKSTLLSWPMLTVWEKKQSITLEKTIEQPTIQVTRVILGEQPITNKTLPPRRKILVFEKSGIKFSIFCKETALKIAERVLQ